MGNYTFEHLNSINLKHYSETCSNEDLCKTTNAEYAKQIPIQSLLFNATSNHFFLTPKSKKNLSKTITTILYPAKEREKI